MSNKRGKGVITTALPLYTSAHEINLEISYPRSVILNNPGKLKVAFFLWFYADYYILELDADYQYAVIGSKAYHVSKRNSLRSPLLILFSNMSNKRGKGVITTALPLYTFSSWKSI